MVKYVAGTGVPRGAIKKVRGAIKMAWGAMDHAPTIRWTLFASISQPWFIEDSCFDSSL